MSDSLDPEFGTTDEVVGAVLADCQPGDRVIVHAQDCETREAGGECPCEPIVIVINATGGTA